jgi:signal transduction histidine kinase
VRGGLGRRLAIASALLAIVVGASFVVLLFAIRDLQATTDARRSEQVELGAANTLQGLVSELQAGLQDFVITGNQQSLRPWTQARAALPGQTATLARLVRGEPTTQQWVRQVSADVSSYIADYGIPLVNAVSRGDASAVSFGAAVEGERRIDAIDGEIGNLRAANAGLLASRELSAVDEARRAVIGAVIGAAASILLLVLAFGYMTRVVVGPIRRAAQMAERIAGGDLGARVPETGTSEIAGLERALNAMGSSLARSRDDLDELLREQAALRRVATLVAQGTRPAEVFAAVSEEIGQLFGADTAAVFQFESDQPAVVMVGASRDVASTIPVGTRLDVSEPLAAAEVYRTGQSTRVDAWERASSSPALADAVRRLGVVPTVASPIAIEGRLWGAVSVASRDKPLPLDAGERLKRFSELVATAIANAHSRAELMASRTRIVAASDEARRRIERDLHDGTQQQLVTLLLDVQAVQAEAPPELEGDLSRIAEQVTGVLDEVREISRGIHPSSLSELGLTRALKALARRSVVPVELDLRTGRRLPDHVEVAAYYAVSEALANTVKHARASAVHVELDTPDSVVRLAIRDDGIGGADPVKGSGLTGLRDRIEAVGGTFNVTSPADGGTTLLIEIPV